MDVTAWAREHGTEYHWHAALDNYEPTRNYAAGALWRYDRISDTRGPGIILEDATDFRDMGRKCSFLIDDGRDVAAYYVAGWHPEGEHLMLQPFPTNFDESGTARVRADDGRPIDFANWQLGPRTTYHLKLTAV